MNGCFTVREARHLTLEELEHYASLNLVMFSPAWVARLITEHRIVTEELQEELDLRCDQVDDLTKCLDTANEQLERLGIERVEAGR